MMSVSRFKHLTGLREALGPYRYLLCVDLEATCDEAPTALSSTRAATVPKAEMETIELGLLVIDLKALEVVDEFQRFVRPVLHPRLTAFCKTITGIRQADIDLAPTYPAVAEQLKAFIAGYPGALWGSWGGYEATQLAMDAARVGCPPMFDGLPHQDLKKWHAKLFSCRAMGLQAALEASGLSWQAAHHRGIDDARNLTTLMLTILTGVPPTTIKICDIRQ